MKKILLAMAVLFGCATVSFAQTSFIATLQHEGEFSHYYGAGALSSAYNAAEAGDIITLSPGTFTSPGTINKGITLRGAGIESDNKTYISGEVTFASTDSTRVTTVEGISFNSRTYVQNNSSGSGQGIIKFIKNYFYQITASRNSTYSSKRGPLVRFYNCIVLGEMYFSDYVYPDFLFYNCYVVNPYCSQYFSETTTAFVNCVINLAYRYDVSSTYYLNFYNSIFNWTDSYGGTDSNYKMPNTATCYNCLSINKTYLFSNLVSSGNNKTIGSASEVFATYTTGYKNGETFELTDAAKEAYIGTDGTQMGMQGGNYPYTTTVQYPIITKFNVDAQTNKAGMLNVEMEVDGE